jgi:DNA-binding response OmpR family regulator
MGTPQAHPAPVVLVVDDEPRVLGYMARALTEAGYRVQTASSGRQALEQAADPSAPLDVLVTDISMPVLTGVELAALVTERRPSTRVLLVTGAPPNLGELPWPVVMKPFSPRALVAAVALLLSLPPGAIY